MKHCLRRTASVAAAMMIAALWIPPPANAQSIVGRVIDATSEQPIGGAHLRFETGHQNATAGSVVSAVSRENDGSFSLNVGDATGILQVSANGYAPQRFRWPGTSSPVTIAMARGAVLRMRITDLTGNPVPATLTLDFAQPGSLSSTSLFAEHGEAEYADAPAGSVVVVARSPGLAPAAAQIATVAGEVTLVPTLALWPAAALSGVVLDVAGLPIRAHVVAYYDPNWPLSRTLTNLLGSGIWTADDGSFRVRNIVPGAPLYVYAQQGQTRSDVAAITLQPAEVREDTILVLRPN